LGLRETKILGSVPLPSLIPPLEQTHAILTARYPLTETSLIVQWCSAECGLFKTVAKGALRAKSPFAGRLDLFVTCEVVFLRSRQSDLHILKEVHLSDARLGLRASYARILAGTYFCRLVEMAAERETPLDEVHDLLRLSLDYLVTHEPSLKLVERLESRLCELLGLGTTTDGATLLAEVFHREIPSQRKTLLETLTRDSGRLVDSGSDFA
jgi:DNA repair protein RecO (recombination protein O)